MTEEETVEADLEPQEDPEIVLVQPVEARVIPKYDYKYELRSTRIRRRIESHDYSTLFICVGCCLLMGLIVLLIASFVFDGICIDAIDNKLLDWLNDNETELRECTKFNTLKNNTLYLKDWVIAQLLFRCLVVTACCGTLCKATLEGRESMGGTVSCCFSIGGFIAGIGVTYYSFEFYESYKKGLNDCKNEFSNNKFNLGKKLGFDMIIVNLLYLSVPVILCCCQCGVLCLILFGDESLKMTEIR